MEQTIGKRIAENRKRLGLTQDQLAEQLGVTAQAVSKWENDQSCPDISTLPRIADIFGISVDALLGREAPVCHGEVVEDPNPTEEHKGNGKLKFHWDGGKKSGIGFAVFVLLVGALYLIANVLQIPASLWDILWPTALLCIGLFGLLERFSFFHICSTLLGGWFLADRFFQPVLQLDSGIIWAAILLILGISLLVDSLRKSKKPDFFATYTDQFGTEHKGKQKSHFELEENSFTYHGSFGESVQTVELAKMDEGEVHCSFGSYTIDLSAVEQVGLSCELELHCSFGELQLLVPRRFSLKPVSSTAFASFSVSGHADPNPAGVIHVDANCSFGEISVEYI